MHAVGWDLFSRVIFHRLNEIRFTEFLYIDSYRAIDYVYLLLNLSYYIILKGLHI